MRRLPQWMLVLVITGCGANIARAEEQAPVWDGNRVELMAERFAPGVYAFYSKDAAALNAKGGAAATSAGLIAGDRAALVVDTMLNERLSRQLQALVKRSTSAPLTYAVNTSSHGDHSYGNMYLPRDVRIIQSAHTKRYVDEYLADDKAFMIKYFGAGRGKLRKVYDFLPDDARIVPGHGVPVDKAELRWNIDYLTAVRDGVQRALAQGLSLEQTVQQVTVPDYAGYALFGWVHSGLNVPAAYKDLSSQK